MTTDSNKQEKRESAQQSGSKPESAAKPDQAKEGQTGAGDSQKPKGVDEKLLKTVHTDVKDEAVEDPLDKEFIKNAK